MSFSWSQSSNYFSSHFNKIWVRSMASEPPVIWLLHLLSLPLFPLLKEFHPLWPPFILQTQKVQSCFRALVLPSPLPGTLPFKSLINCRLLKEALSGLQLNYSLFPSAAWHPFMTSLINNTQLFACSLAPWLHFPTMECKLPLKVYVLLIVVSPALRIGPGFTRYLMN